MSHRLRSDANERPAAPGAAATSARVSRRGAVLFRVPREALRALGEDVPAESGAALVEPLTFSATLRVSGGEVFFALAARAPSLAPYGQLRMEGEIGLVDPQEELWRARAFSGTLATPRPAPEARFAAIGFGKRDDLLRRKFWDSEEHVVFGLLLGKVRLLPDSGNVALPAVDRPLLDPHFVMRRLQAENAALKGQVRQLGATLDTVLEAACPSAAPDLPAVALATAARVAVAQHNLTALRGLRDALAAILVTIDEGLRGGENPEGAEAEPCCVCLDRPPDTRFLPCAHACCCAACAAPLAACPLCRAAIAGRQPAAAPEPR